MDRLEAADVITGYTATVDPERAGFEFVFLFTCTVRISERTRVADEIIGMSGVIQVTELMTGQHNLLIRAVGRDDEDITRLAERIDGLQLEINDESLVRTEHTAALDFVKVTDDAAVE
jgi:DNA-binding Lrp family transcriptional regulator